MSSRSSRYTIVIFCGLLVLSGIGATALAQGPASPESSTPYASMEMADNPGLAIARVGSSVLTLEDYLFLRELYSTEGLPQPDPQSIIDAWVDQEIVYREAQSISLDAMDTVGVMLRRLEFAYQMQRRNLLFQAWVADQSSKIEIPERQMRDYFRKNKENFLSEIKVSQIVVSDPMLAAYIYQKLLEGVAFKTLARQYTLDTLKGEPTPFLPMGSGYFLSFSNEDVVFALKPGQFTMPLQTSEGVSVIFKLEDKVKVRKDISFEEVEPYIHAKLRYERSQELLSSKLDSLKQSAKNEIELYPENLPR